MLARTSLRGGKNKGIQILLRTAIHTFLHFSPGQVEHISALHFPLEFLVLVTLTQIYQMDTAVILL